MESFSYWTPNEFVGSCCSFTNEISGSSASRE